MPGLEPVMTALGCPGNRKYVMPGLDPGIHDSDHLIVEIIPIRVLLVDQPNLP